VVDLSPTQGKVKVKGTGVRQQWVSARAPLGAAAILRVTSEGDLERRVLDGRLLGVLRGELTWSGSGGPLTEQLAALDTWASQSGYHIQRKAYALYPDGV
jgi:hypothetical protein